MVLVSVSNLVTKSLGKFKGIFYTQSFPQVILGVFQIYQFVKGWGSCQAHDTEPTLCLRTRLVPRSSGGCQTLGSRTAG